MPVPSDDDSESGHYVPGLDGDRERRLRYQEKLKDAEDLRKRLVATSNSGPSDIFDFSIRQKERRIAIDCSSSDEELEKKPFARKSSTVDVKQRNKRKPTRKVSSSDSSDSDVIEISAFKRPGRSKARKPNTDPLLKKLDLRQPCSENMIKQVQSQDPELRRTMAIVAESSKLIEEIRTPIDLDHKDPGSPVKIPKGQKLPDLIPLDKVERNGQDSDIRLKICLRILDSESQFFTNTHAYVDDSFEELHRKIAQYFGRIWLTIDGYEIDLKATPSQLGLEDGATIKVSISKPSKGLYESRQRGAQAAADAANLITLKLCVSGKQEIHMKVAPEDTFAKIRERLRTEHGFEKVMFLMDGERIDESESVSGLDLEDGDQIDIKIS